MKLNTLVVCLSTLGVCSSLSLAAPAVEESAPLCPLQKEARVPAPVQDAFGGRIEKDPRVRTYVTPARIVWQSQNSDKSTVKNAECLLKNTSGQISLTTPDFCALENKGEPASILIDFGTELSGGIQIGGSGTSTGQPVEVRVRFGESVSEAMSELGGKKNATNDHAVRDQTTLIPWLGTAEIGNTGFRFVRIDLVQPNSTLNLKFTRAVFLFNDLPYLGSFQSNDERLNQIWNTGAYTVQLNMQNYVWDGFKRDRLVWIGDMHPETMTINSVFGANWMVPRSLDLVRDETPLGSWMNGISSYSIWWLLIHNDWYRMNGDFEYLKEQQPYLTGFLRQLLGCVDENGKEKMPPGRFLDWPSNANPQAIHAGLQSLMILSFDAGVTLCDALGEKELSAQCEEMAAKMRTYIPDPNNSKQAAALMALAGLEDAKKLNEEVMAVDGALRMSTFYGYYVLLARAMAEDYQGALDVIRQYWGGMLDMGATTFWEDFDIEWMENAARIDELVPEGKIDIHGDYGNYCYIGLRHSLSHGWASGPTAWLSEYVLGVRVEDGGKKVSINPHLCDLEWVEGSFPLKDGVLKIRHEKQADGSLKTEVSAPGKVKIVSDTKNMKMKVKRSR
ncbi:MAG: alpha-L-rhamnosidase [Limisphaerales bacterium]|jgi:alpha-L-rhamnosidase|nr:alpha-L-rhamnosidase [Verrucomicrobiota bacterium]